MPTAPATELRQAFQRVVIIYAFLIASLFLYASVVELIKREFVPFDGFFPFPQVDILRYILLALAIAYFVLTRYIKGYVLSATSPVKTALYQSKPFSEPIQRLYLSSVIAGLMCAATAIYGLVLFLAAGNALDYYLFAALSLVLFAANFPRYTWWEQWINKQSQ